MVSGGLLSQPRGSRDVGRGSAGTHLSGDDAGGERQRRHEHEGHEAAARLHFLSIIESSFFIIMESSRIDMQPPSTNAEMITIPITPATVFVAFAMTASSWGCDCANGGSVTEQPVAVVTAL